jgi:hypothetical protein
MLSGSFCFYPPPQSVCGGQSDQLRACVRPWVNLWVRTSVPGLNLTVLIRILWNLVGILRLISASENQKIDDLGQGHQGQRSKFVIFTSSIGSFNQIVFKFGRNIVPVGSSQCETRCPRSTLRDQRSRLNTQKRTFSALALAIPIGLSSNSVGVFRYPRQLHNVMHDAPDQGQGVKGQGQILKNDHFYL